MDPLSIAGSSAALRASCYELVTFTNQLSQEGVPDEDSTIAGLGWDLHYASQTLDEINLTWRSSSSVFMIHPSAGLGMWPNVQNNLHSTASTLQGLKEKMLPVMNSGRRGGLMGLGAKAWALGRQIKAISNYRRRVQAHHMALKVAAGMMRMSV
ncbi:hypothetical protein B0T10DRAFT_411713 [Thelonectria olida]|uniref:Uncharacterized protein n=1 Tax=Thelonectria olida TaxID=1576542 RepID=A0A9P8VWH9_9HYPO|nr:hypothetical protein B0T10DRAFT_411713 [Thelonectria olida]